jgi:hypothetical protein
MGFAPGLALHFLLSGQILMPSKIRWPLCAAIFTLLFVACNAPPKPDSQEAAQALKILVANSGIYQIEAKQLRAAGWATINFDSGQIQLLYHGRPQPFWVQGQGDESKLRFYAQSTDSRYTGENIYWLVQKGFSKIAFGNDDNAASPTGAQLFEGVPPALLDPVNTYLTTARFEQNQVYSPQVQEGDHWFWLSLPAPQTQEFELELDHVAPGPGRVSVEVWASTEAPGSPDHHLILNLNGQQVASEKWDGKGRRRILADSPSGLLRDGVNLLQVDAPGDTGVAADITFLDWIAIQYPRNLVAVSDRLEFDSQADAQHLDGFTGPVTVYDISKPEAVELVNENSQAGDGLDFKGISGHRYLALGEDGYLKPAAILPAKIDPDLRAVELQADFIAIGPEDLLEPLQPLLDWRESQDLRTVALPVEAIYDQFNGGLPEPGAIQDFLRFAATHWQAPPKYVLLVGDATYDPRGYVSSPIENRLPVFLVNTVFGGETASDVLFAQLDEDAWPDLALGRIPAQTPQQVKILVSKILEYEQEGSNGDWRQRLLAVADGQTPYFQTEAQDFLDRFPGSFKKDVFAPQAGASGTNVELARLIDDGSLLVAYFGHGSVNMWGKDRLFSTEDVQGLSNEGRLPVVVNMTCLTGLFTHPKIESLAEALLWQSAGGAVAVLAPTSLTLPTDQGFLSQALADAMAANPDLTLGDILQDARMKVPADTPGTLDVMQTFLLFGDPALQLRHP